MARTGKRGRLPTESGVLNGRFFCGSLIRNQIRDMLIAIKTIIVEKEAMLANVSMDPIGKSTTATKNATRAAIHGVCFF